MGDINLTLVHVDIVFCKAYVKDNICRYTITNGMEFTGNQKVFVLYEILILIMVTLILQMDILLMKKRITIELNELGQKLGILLFRERHQWALLQLFQIIFVVA